MTFLRDTRPGGIEAQRADAELAARPTDEPRQGPTAAGPVEPPVMMLKLIAMLYKGPKGDDVQGLRLQFAVLGARLIFAVDDAFAKRPAGIDRSGDTGSPTGVQKSHGSV